MGTTLTKKEEGKKPVRARRVKPVVEAKPTPAPKKRVAKSVPKKVQAKVKKVTPAAAKVTKTTEPELVYVPSSASLRLLEKVELYTLWYQKYLPDYVAGAAKIGGYAFILLGASFASFTYLYDRDIFSTEPAALVCSETTCTDVPDSALPETAAVVTFLNSLPATIEADIDFSITLSYTAEVEVAIKALASGEKIILTPISNKSATEQTYLIPGKNLKPGFYALSATTKDEEYTYVFEGPTFSKVASPVTEEAAVEINLGESELEAATTTETLAEVIEETLPEEVLDSTAEEPESPQEEEILNEEESETEETVQAENTESAAEEIETQTTTATAPLSLTINSQGGSYYATINTGAFNPDQVEVYSIVNGSTESLFLGLATRVQNEWVFSLTALELPAANHLIYAVFTETGKVYQTEGVAYTPLYTNLPGALSDIDINILLQKIELALLAGAVTSENRSTYYTYLMSGAETLFVQADELAFTENNLIETIDETLTADTERLNALMLRYAAAVQGGTDYLTSLAAGELETHYKELASTVAAELGDTSLVPSIHTILAIRYQVLKDNVKELEEQIKQDTNDLTARDTDGDGISDFDEVAFFKTNPALTDTDHDGVLDGVEIITTSDPTVADVTSLVSAQKPVEDVSYGGVIDIQKVEPLKSRVQGSDTENVFVIVHGQTVPFAYVYLLSGTTNTTGIIKANAAGQFSYTLEKALTDGEHHISAVLVDTDGKIVASSRPHQFVKTDNRFQTAAAIQSAGDITAESTEKSTTLYVLVAAVGVITFGFILLLLGDTLRKRRPKNLAQA